MKVLILDAYNLMHRARSGFTKGEWPVVYNFFRSLRPLIEKFNPDVCYFVLEGTPKKNLELLPSYKGSRTIDPEKDPKKHYAMVSFHRQKDVIIDMMINSIPGIKVVRHPDFEADDVMASLAVKHHADDDVTIVSGDSDMIQVLQQCDNTRLYHPIKKAFVAAPDYDYITWKALCGDATDDIPGLPKVGDKTAKTLTMNEAARNAWFHKKPGHQEIFEKNLELVGLSSVPVLEIEHFTGEKSWDKAKTSFEKMGFSSMLKDKTWVKYTATFECLR